MGKTGVRILDRWRMELPRNIQLFQFSFLNFKVQYGNDKVYVEYCLSSVYVSGVSQILQLFMFDSLITVSYDF